MTARLTAGLLVSALVRRMQAAGGHAMLLAKGDPTAGAILLVLTDRGRTTALLERTLGADGYILTPTGPADPDAPGTLPDYLARRRQRDPDLWVVELEGAEAAAVAGEVLG